MNDLIEMETLEIVHKCANDEAPSYLVLLSVTREHLNTEKVQFLPMTCGQNCFSFSGAKFWNGVETKSKLTKTFKQFKSCLENSRT